MGQYAFIPASRANEIKMAYSISSPASWQFEKDGAKFGGFEEVVFTTEQRAEIESLGGQCFDDSQAFSDWMSSHNDALSQVIADRQFGQKLLNEFLAENKTMKLTTTEALSLLGKLNTVKALLESGSITAAKEVLNTVTTDAIFTDQRKANFIAKMSAYLA